MGRRTALTGSGELWFNFRTNPKTGVEVGYKERDPGYTNAGDRHQFWELLCVDKGLVRILLDGTEFTVCQGEFVLIAPNQWHAVPPSATVAPFYITVHFETNFEQLGDLMNTVLRVDEKGRQLLVNLLKEKGGARIGACELARCHLAEFLIRAVRARRAGMPAEALPTYFQAHAENEIVEKAVADMRRHFGSPLSLHDISRAAGVSHSHLEHIFKKKTGMPVMAYLQDLRIQNAKKLLLESTLNVSQIAEQSGYSSVHLFSRRFKKFVSVPPSQYAKMVRLGLSANDNNS